MAAFRALGASAVPIPFGEVYGALQQKVVDGMDLPLGNISAAKLYEVVKNISLTEHIYTPHVFIMNLNAVQLAAAGRPEGAARRGEGGLGPRAEAERRAGAAMVRRAPAEGHEDRPGADKRPFMDKMRPVWAQFERQIGKDVIEEAVNTK